jgi:hypothetical protein
MLTRLKQNHKKAILFFAAVCLISTLAVAFHHHDDDHPHFDCPLCIAANSLSNSSIEDTTSFVFHSLITCFQQPEEPLFQAVSIFFTYPNRAPPLAA